MGENTKIEWATHTFNPWIGCTKVSPGCANCYAETLMDARYGRVKWGKGQPRSRTGKANWRKPVLWNKAAAGAAVRPRVFCASLSDWLDEEVQIEWLLDLLRLIRRTPALDWLLLSKRPERFHARLAAVMDGFSSNCCTLEDAQDAVWIRNMMEGWESVRYCDAGQENYWIGTSAEDQTRWDERMAALMKIPARVRFVSAEPLIGGVHMGELRPDWLIVGGESGPGARPMEREWVEHLRDQCDDRTAFHFKQWGGTNKAAAGRVLDGRTWEEVPGGERMIF